MHRTLPRRLAALATRGAAPMALPTIALVAALMATLTATPRPAAAQALGCEPLRAEVEARIRSKVSGPFSVEVADTGAKLPGEVVGSCERGSKKLVYLKGGGATGATGPARPAPAASGAAPRPAKAPPVITECADGRVITSGSCRSPEAGAAGTRP
jgi:hypothetical protein